MSFSSVQWISAAGQGSDKTRAAQHAKMEALSVVNEVFEETQRPRTPTEVSPSTVVVEGETSVPINSENRAGFASSITFGCTLISIRTVMENCLLSEVFSRSIR